MNIDKALAKIAADQIWSGSTLAARTLIATPIGHITQRLGVSALALMVAHTATGQPLPRP